MASVDPNRSSLTDSSFTSGAEAQGGAKIAKFKGKLDEATEVKRGKLDRLVSGTMRTILRPYAEHQAKKLENKIEVLNDHRAGKMEFPDEQIKDLEGEIQHLESIPYVKTLYLQNTLKKSLQDEKANLANLKKRASSDFESMKATLGFKTTEANLAQRGKELEELSDKINELKSIPEKSADQTAQLRMLQTKFDTKLSDFRADSAELETRLEPLKQSIFGDLALAMRESESNIHLLTEAFEGTSTHKEALLLQKEWGSIAKELQMEPSTFVGKAESLSETIDDLKNEISEFKYDLDASDEENSSTLQGFAERIDKAIEQFQSLSEKDLKKDGYSKNAFEADIQEAKDNLSKMAGKMDLAPPTTRELEKPASEEVPTAEPKPAEAETEAVRAKPGLFTRGIQGIQRVFASAQPSSIEAAKFTGVNYSKGYHGQPCSMEGILDFAVTNPSQGWTINGDGTLHGVPDRNVVLAEGWKAVEDVMTAGYPEAVAKSRNEKALQRNLQQLLQEAAKAFAEATKTEASPGGEDTTFTFTAQIEFKGQKFAVICQVGDSPVYHVDKESGHVTRHCPEKTAKTDAVANKFQSSTIPLPILIPVKKGDVILAFTDGLEKPDAATLQKEKDGEERYEAVRKRQGEIGAERTRNNVAMRRKHDAGIDAATSDEESQRLQAAKDKELAQLNAELDKEWELLENDPSNPKGIKEDYEKNVLPKKIGELVMAGKTPQEVIEAISREVVSEDDGGTGDDQAGTGWVTT